MSTYDSICSPVIVSGQNRKALVPPNCEIAVNMQRMRQNHGLPSLENVNSNGDYALALARRCSL